MWTSILWLWLIPKTLHLWHSRQTWGYLSKSRQLSKMTNLQANIFLGRWIHKLTFFDICPISNFLIYFILTQNVIGEISGIQCGLLVHRILYFHQFFFESYFVGVRVVHHPKRHQTDCIWTIQIQQIFILWFKKFFAGQAILAFINKLITSPAFISPCFSNNQRNYSTMWSTPFSHSVTCNYNFASPWFFLMNHKK